MMVEFPKQTVVGIQPQKQQQTQPQRRVRTRQVVHVAYAARMEHIHRMVTVQQVG